MAWIRWILGLLWSAGTGDEDSGGGDTGGSDESESSGGDS